MRSFTPHQCISYVKCCGIGRNSVNLYRKVEYNMLYVNTFDVKWITTLCLNSWAG